MKTRNTLPILILSCLVIIFSLACGFSVSTPIPPTNTPRPTNTFIPPTNTPLPTRTPVPTQSIFFTEEFSDDLGNLWDLILLGPGRSHAEKLEAEFVDDSMRITIDDEQIYAYYIYNAYDYEDVRLDLRVENLGVNSQNISLICRASADGWYEFSVGSDGLWYLWAQHEGNYDLLVNGGSLAVLMGHATNEYTMICEGDQISMFINGQEVAYSPFRPLIFYYVDGEVGFNISSLYAYPVITDVEWMRISQP
jgi:hypothetical protein